jgi:hypothetical protein
VSILLINIVVATVALLLWGLALILSHAIIDWTGYSYGGMALSLTVLILAMGAIAAGAILTLSATGVLK